MKIKTFGAVDERSLEQLQRCMAAGDAELGVLCADHHPGYSQLIGGGIAYEGYVSPSGVGYDIGCIAAGARVTAEAHSAAIERVGTGDPLVCIDAGSARRISPHIGAVARGRRQVLELELANGRALALTPDHRVLTKRGWVEAGALDESDRVACMPFVGLPHEPYSLPAELIRLVAYVSGDGHLTRDGKRVAIYTTVEADARALAEDATALGYQPRFSQRERGAGRRAEILVRIDSRELHERLAELGSPVGRKRWDGRIFAWLLAAPAWARAHFLSAFASAEMSTPRIADGLLTSLALKQADPAAAKLVVDLLASLDFRASIAPSADQTVIQVLGGEQEQVRFFEEIGFCRATDKRVAAAAAASIAWQRQALVLRRYAARLEALSLRSTGAVHREVVADVAARFDVPRGFVHHAIYDQRPLLHGLGVSFRPDSTGEAAWVPVDYVGDGGSAEVWDVVTGDTAESFLAEGIVVHNCGNKAARTELSPADLDRLGGVERIMREITRRISFGMGVPAQERVEHPVLDKIRTADFAPQRKLVQLAESQLGTVGSGNHYVNLMADEDGRIWVGVHFGSRGFGHKTASGFLALAQGLPFDGRAHEGEMDSPPVLFEVGSELGEAYVSAMELAGEYAYAGRDVVASKVLEILGGEATHEVHNHHNFCIPGSARVQTPIGPVRMADIRPGDVVFSVDAESGPVRATVTAHWKSGRKPIHTIRSANRSLRASGDHPVLTVAVRRGMHPQRRWMSKSIGRFAWKRAEDIRPGDLLVCTEGCVDGADGGVGVDLARLTGAFLGDGWRRHTDPGRNSRYTVGLAIGGPQEAHTDRYLGLCRELFPAQWRSNRPGEFGLTCSSRAVHERVTALGIASTSLKKRIPQWVFSLPRAERMAVIAGYADADGSVANDRTYNHGCGAVCSTNEELVRDLRELAISCGLRTTNANRERRRTNFATERVATWRFTIDAASMRELDLWHEGKRSNLRRSGGRSTLGLRPSAIGYLDLPVGVFVQRVRSVEVSAEVEEVFDLEVDHPSHSFVCENVVVHNCWREEHQGRTYWVIRKGCTPARPGQEGFVGGSMGDESVILEGVAGPEAEESLFSTVHGAGRVMSRTQAAGRVRHMSVWACSDRDCPFQVPTREYKGQTCPTHPQARMRKIRAEVQLRPGVVDWPAVQARLREQGIVLVGGGADEAPEVYKRLPEVLAAHAGSIRVKHTLRPLGVAMAGRDVHDPYKD